MKRMTVRVGTAREFFERGRSYAKLARSGETPPKSRLITFEDPVGKTRKPSAVRRTLLRAR